jgi:hypothetical protein
VEESNCIQSNLADQRFDLELHRPMERWIAVVVQQPMVQH